MKIKKWHHFAWQIATAGQEPEWWVDLFLADTIVREIVSNHGSDITLWRIHRRAGNDTAGHEFKFDAYVDEKVAQEINGFVHNHTSYSLLHGSNRLRKYSCTPEDDSKIEAISETFWSKEVQHAWPYFIEGVSRMLLELIEQVGKPGSSDDNLSEIKRVELVYTEVHKRLSYIWQQKGSDVFLHHINAMFAYVPVLVNQTFLANF